MCRLWDRAEEQELKLQAPHQDQNSKYPMNSNQRNKEPSIPETPPELAQHITSSCAGQQHWKAQNGDERSQGRERSPSPHHAEQELREKPRWKHTTSRQDLPVPNAAHATVSWECECLGQQQQPSGMGGQEEGVSLEGAGRP